MVQLSDTPGSSKKARILMRRNRKVKILATLGPASSDSAMIRKLFEAGADVFRINMSHTPHDKMRELVKTIRNVESSYGRPIGILVDLQGPKLRVGAFAEGGCSSRTARASRSIPTRARRRHPRAPAASGNSRCTSPGPCAADRRRQAAADCRGDTANDRAVTRVVVGGRKISDRKGVSLPDTTCRCRP
jgi:pyruvate kinase